MITSRVFQSHWVILSVSSLLPYGFFLFRCESLVYIYSFHSRPLIVPYNQGKILFELLLRVLVPHAFSSNSTNLFSDLFRLVLPSNAFVCFNASLCQSEAKFIFIFSFLSNVQTNFVVKPFDNAFFFAN